MLWIDFDYSVLQTEEPRYYPESWNLQISDGTRHPDSLPGQPILREHDLFSFSELLRCYRPEMAEDALRWLKLSRALGGCSSIDGMVELLEGFIRLPGEIRLLSLIPPEFQARGTGLPTQER